MQTAATKGKANRTLRVTQEMPSAHKSVYGEAATGISII